MNWAPLWFTRPQTSWCHRRRIKLPRRQHCTTLCTNPPGLTLLVQSLVRAAAEVLQKTERQRKQCCMMLCMNPPLLAQSLVRAAAEVIRLQITKLPRHCTTMCTNPPGLTLLVQSLVRAAAEVLLLSVMERRPVVPLFLASSAATS